MPIVRGVLQTHLVYEDDYTHCYVLIQPQSDHPSDVGGWHYKVFPASVSPADVLAESFLAIKWDLALSPPFAEGG